MGFPDDAGQFIRVPFYVPVVVDAIGNPQFIQSGTQIQKDSRLASGPGPAADNPTNQFARVAIKR